jgi:hypothetical protein
MVGVKNTKYPQLSPYASMTKQTWSSVKAQLNGLSSVELLRLIAELYQLSKQNQGFLHARYIDAGSALSDCKNVIEEYLYPDIQRDRPLQMTKAKKAVSDFCKAVADPVAHAELMVFFVEQGNAFTVDYGDIDAGFYSALVSMYDRAVRTVSGLSSEAQGLFRDRLAEIVSSSRGIGWGYHDELSHLYTASFPDQD